jgi:hypothetical protein
MSPDVIRGNRLAALHPRRGADERTT